MYGKSKSKKHKKTSLIKTLQKPIDPNGVVIDSYNSISNIGLRLVADKVDAIGSAIALLLKDRDELMDEQRQLGYNAGRRDGNSEARDSIRQSLGG